MATLTYPSTIVGGTTEDVSQLNSNLTAIQQVVNSLDDANLAANAGIQESKLASGATGLLKGAFSAYRNTAQTITSAFNVVFDTEEYDQSGWYDQATGIFTPQIAGIYSFSWMIWTGGSITADVALTANLIKNAALARRGMEGIGRGTNSISAGGSAEDTANGTTDAFQIQVSLGSGSIAMRTGRDASFFQAKLVGRT